MKSSEILRLPMISVDNIKIPRLILGHLPFIGESYQGPVKNAEYSRRFSNIKNIEVILGRAVKEYGITVMSAPTPIEGGGAEKLFRAIQRTSQNTKVEVALIVCLRIPLTIEGHPVDDYRRWLTYYNIEKQNDDADLLKRYLNDPVLQARENWGVKLLQALENSRPYSQELVSIEVDYGKIKEALAGLKDMRVLFIELGSETDLLSMGNRLDVLSDLTTWINITYGYQCLLASHHAGSTMPILEKSKVEFHGYVTPANDLGVMMFPTKKSSEVAIRNSSKPVIAIKPLAGGRIPPKPAFKYVYDELDIPCCMIGVGSENELKQDASAALEILLGKMHATD